MKTVFMVLFKEELEDSDYVCVKVCHRNGQSNYW
jgi:hypothetical protein